MRRAVFLDRDGVVNAAVRRPSSMPPEDSVYTAPYLVDEFKVFPEVPDVIQAIRRLGFLAIVITNQPDVGYGNMTEEAFNEIMRQTRALGFDDIFICRHGRNEECGCKKPKPGMFFSAPEKWEIDLSGSYIIGDTKIDTLAGQAAGCTTILVERPYNKDDRDTAHLLARSLADAVEIIKKERTPYENLY